ncbi:MAG TPA: tetratricopeptide repeat protein, partial [Pyrinomonadaceae bacterium]|nr:tetratricopeptide repeat protein [Pyrinomonadaceae bacterium]
MYPETVPTIRGSRSFMVLFLGLLVLSAMEISIFAQSPPAQLTLADIIVALRSQKVTLVERNRILTDAVLVRGITFALTPEIEKELTATGADKELVKAIKTKGPTVKVSAVVPSNDLVKPDFLAHQQQADASFARGDVDAAVVEYSRAIELQPSLSSAYFSRGRIYLMKGWYDKAVSDFSKSVELDPKDAAAFTNRGQAWEKKGDS